MFSASVEQVGTVKNEFRVFKMELLAGKATFETEVKQHGARFRLNFAQVKFGSWLAKGINEASMCG